MKVLLLALLVCACVSQNTGKWLHQEVYGADYSPCLNDLDTRYHVWQHESKSTAPADTRTHYHYDYQFLDHSHYVTINYMQGVGRRGRSAGLLAFEPFNRTSKGQQVPPQTFKFNLPEGATVEEQYHYEYTYAYHDHTHYVSGFDAELLPWWEQPPWFKTTEEPLKFDFAFEVTKDPTKKDTLDINVEAVAQQLFMPKTPDELRDQTRQADATNTVRKDGPFVSFPVKGPQGSYDLIKVPLTNETHNETFKAPEDQSTHHRYIHRTQEHTWYIPLDEQTTVSRNKKTANAQQVVTTFAPQDTVKSDSNNVVIHYHINTWYHLHNHLVYYAENNWFNKEDTACKLREEGTPVLLPGTRPEGDTSNNIYLNKEHNYSHPKDAQVHFTSMYAHLQRDHKQQLFRNQNIKSESGQRTGRVAMFFYEPEQQVASKNHVHHNSFYFKHEHNHTVLLRGASPPGVIQLLDSEMDATGDYQQDVQLLLLKEPVISEELPESFMLEEEAASGWGSTIITVLGVSAVLLCVGAVLFNKNKDDHSYYAPLYPKMN